MTNAPSLPLPPNAQSVDPNVQLPDPNVQATDVNPSNHQLSITEQIEKGVRRRVSMSLPSRRLEVPTIPGYWLHWFLEANIPRALEAGFEFVDTRDIPMTQFSPGTSRDINGNMDMGTRVRQIGGKAEGGGTEYLVLMKLREEWAAEDRALRDNRNADILSTIFRGERIMGADGESVQDRQQRYVKQAALTTSPDPERQNAPLFQRPPRKRV